MESTPTNHDRSVPRCCRSSRWARSCCLHIATPSSVLRARRIVGITLFMPCIDTLPSDSKFHTTNVSRCMGIISRRLSLRGADHTTLFDLNTHLITPRATIPQATCHRNAPCPNTLRRAAPAPPFSPLSEAPPPPPAPSPHPLSPPGPCSHPCPAAKPSHASSCR